MNKQTNVQNSETEEQDSSSELEPRSPRAITTEIRSTPSFFERLSYVFRPQSYADIRQNLQNALDSNISHEDDTTISNSERSMLSNILRLREVKVSDVMIPRAEIDAVDESISLSDLLSLFVSSGHSRMPVYDESLDDPRGMVHIRDIVGYLTKTGGKKKTARRTSKVNGSRTTVNNTTKSDSAPQIGALDLTNLDLSKPLSSLKLMRKVLFVPPSMLATDLMARMQTERIQIALVIDEYGGTDGLVSLEDIVEMVVGDIEDEHDEQEVRIEPQNDGSFIVDARVYLEQTREYVGDAFVKAAEDEEDEIDSVGGLIFSILGRVPVKGEIIPSFAGYEIEILAADPRRVRQAKLKPLKSLVRRRSPRRDSEIYRETEAQDHKSES